MSKPNPIHITFGIILFLGIIILGNIIVYDSLIQLFDFSISRETILILLFLMSLGWIITFMFGRKYYNFPLRTFYILTSVWMSFLIYIFLASLLYFLVYIVSGKNNIVLGEILIFLPIIFLIYGLINGKFLTVRKFEIKLPNLPEAWLGRKAVWVSDLHIGLVYGKKHVERIIEKINELQPDIVFIGGDLFDGISAPPVINFADSLKKIRAPLGIYFVSGNHEHYGNFNLFMEKIKSLGIQILTNEIKKIEGMQIIGIEYSQEIKNHFYRKLLSELDIDKEKPSILLRHEPRDIKIAEQAGIDFQISGHTHNAQQWPLNYYAKLSYKKYVYGLKRHSKMLVYTSSGAGTWGPAIRVGSRNEIVEFTFVK